MSRKEHPPYYEQIANKLIKQLEDGTAPFLHRWEPGEDLMPYNPFSGTRYKGANVVNLILEGRGDPRWMTYKQALDNDAQVRRGEKAVAIQYWKFYDEKTAKDKDGRVVLDDDGKPKKERFYLDRPRVFWAYVFNAEQVDGLPALEINPLTEKQIFERNERCELVLRNSDVPITNRGNNAYYSRHSDSITLPRRELFVSESAYYATAMHELGHATGHPSRLNREMGDGFGSEKYAREELRAEIASLMIGDELTIGHDPGNHASYIAGWIAVLKNDPKEILRASRDAEHIAEVVIALEQSLEQSKGVIAKYRKNDNDLIQSKYPEEAENISNKDYFFQEIMWSEVDSKSVRGLLDIEERQYLAVPFTEKETAKKNGARWDQDNKSWYVLDIKNKPSLAKYLPNIKIGGGKRIEDFILSAQSIGLDMSSADLKPGKRHRVSLSGKSSKDKDGEYRIFSNSDGTIGAYAINYASGEKITWSNRSQEKLPYEVYMASQAQQAYQADNALIVDNFIGEERAKLAQEAYLKLDNAIGNEPYLQKKGMINIHGLKRLDDGSIVVPLIDGNKITSLQVIGNEGEKFLMRQGQKQGSYFTFGDRKSPNRIIIAEGVATAEAVHQIAGDTQTLTVATIDSNNLVVVGQKLLDRYPQAEIVVATDNDIQNEKKGIGNTGKIATKALVENAERRVSIVSPDPIDSKNTDWNDRLLLKGLQTTKKEFKTQLSPSIIQKSKKQPVERVM